jgi:predicted Holliday junction resolvase-like endonuclease
MQTSNEDEIASELKELYDFQVLEKSIKELNAAVEVIKNGIKDEFQQVEMLQDIHKQQKRRVASLRAESTVDIHIFNQEKQYLRHCRAAVQHSATVLEGLNGFLTDRLKQLHFLYKKREAYIEKFRPAKVLNIKGNT